EAWTDSAAGARLARSRLEHHVALESGQSPRCAACARVQPHVQAIARDELGRAEVARELTPCACRRHDHDRWSRWIAERKNRAAKSVQIGDTHEPCLPWRYHRSFGGIMNERMSS